MWNLKFLFYSLVKKTFKIPIAFMLLCVYCIFNISHKERIFPVPYGYFNMGAELNLWIQNICLKGTIPIGLKWLSR